MRSAFAITTKTIAAITILMSIPLLLSYNIKYQRFPQGLPYALLYSAGLLSVIVTPLLLVCGFTTLVWALLSSDLPKKGSFGWNVVAVIIGVIAECVFIAARFSRP